MTGRTRWENHDHNFDDKPMADVPYANVGKTHLKNSVGHEEYLDLVIDIPPTHVATHEGFE